MDEGRGTHLVLVLLLLPVLGYFVYDAYVKWENSPAQMARRQAATRAATAAMAAPTVSPGGPPATVPGPAIAPDPMPAAATPAAAAPDPWRLVRVLMPGLLNARDRLRARLLAGEARLVARDAAEPAWSLVEEAAARCGVTLRTAARHEPRPEAAAPTTPALALARDFDASAGAGNLAAFLTELAQLPRADLCIESAFLVPQPPTPGNAERFDARLRITLIVAADAPPAK